MIFGIVNKLCKTRAGHPSSRLVVLSTYIQEYIFLSIRSIFFLYILIYFYNIRIHNSPVKHCSVCLQSHCLSALEYWKFKSDIGSVPISVQIKISSLSQ